MSEPYGMDESEESKEIVGRILGALYASHPAEPWNGPELVYGRGFTITDREEGLYWDAIEYLFDNDCIAIPQDAFLRLRDEAYDALGKPNPLKPEQTLGSGLAELAESTGQAVARQDVDALVSSTLEILPSRPARGWSRFWKWFSA